MYGSSFIMATDSPQLLSSRPMDATAIPLPTEDATPPVTNRNFDMSVPPTALCPADISGLTTPTPLLCRLLRRATSASASIAPCVPLIFAVASAYSAYTLVLGSQEPEHASKG